MTQVIIDECNVNSVHLVGRVVTDISLSRTKEKKIPVVNFKLLTKQYVGSTGNVIMQYHRIVCWNELAKNVAERIKKNMTVEVFGEITNRKYTTTDENNNTVVIALSEIKAFKVTPFKGRIRKSFDTQDSETQK